MKKQKKKLSPGVKAVIIILLVAAVGMLGFSVYKLVGIDNSYKEANNLYDDIASIVMATTEAEKRTVPEPTTEAATLVADVTETVTEPEGTTEVVAETEITTETATEPEGMPETEAVSEIVVAPEPVPETIVEREATTVTEAEATTETILETEAVSEVVTEEATETVTAVAAGGEPETVVPVEAVTEDPLEDITEVTTEAATEIPTETATEVPVETTTEIPTEAATEVPTEAATEATTEAPAEAPTEAATAEPADGQDQAVKDDLQKQEEQKEVRRAIRHFRYASMNWNFDTLYSLCQDSVGWIYSEDTPISYPVVQAEDNNKYLRHMINGEYNVAGTLFVDSRFEQGLDGNYSTIYGHNMDDKSMFGSITSYKNEEYYKEHPEMELYIGDRMYAYEVYAAFQVQIDSNLFSYFDEIPKTMAEKATKEAEYDKVLQEIRNSRLYVTDAKEIDKNSHLVVLVTCIDYPRDYNYRFVVVLERKEVLLHPTWKEIIEPENVEKESE